MPTFSEVKDKYMLAKYKKQIIDHLVEYIDMNFMGGGADPYSPKKTMLLSEEKVPVPTTAFEAVVNDVLLAEAKDLDETIQDLMTAEVSTKGK